MTQTLDTPTQTPAQRVERWLADFEEALRARDVARAAGMFAATSFWRDLVAFTWNITTVENPDGVADLLTATLDRTDPTGFAVDEPPDEADGVTTAWFTFETAVGRGRGAAPAGRGGRPGEGVHLSDHAVRAEGVRGTPRAGPADGRRARCEQAPPHVAG